MGFWIYMLLMDLLIPAAMLGFGWLFRKRPPRRINALFGYRTAMSMKNQDTWDFAHRFIGKAWGIAGGILLPAALIPMVFVLDRETLLVGKVGGILCGLQLAVMLGTIILTEAALKKAFDPYGNRR